MKERIKQIRKNNNLTQQEFAEWLGVGRSTIAGYESGERIPVSAVITLICREFGISEEWLRYGTGQMQSGVSREKEIAALMRSSLRGTEEFKEAVIRIVSSRTEAELEVLEKMLWDIVYSLQGEKEARTGESRHGQRVIKIAGRDGSLEERTLTSDETGEALDRIDRLPDAGDDL